MLNIIKKWFLYLYKLYNKNNFSWSDTLILFFGSILIIFAVYTSVAIPLQPTLQRGIFLLLLVPLVVIFYPSKPIWRVMDYIVMILNIVPLLYLLLNWEALAYRSLFEPTIMEYIFGFAITIGVLEMTRRVVGWPLFIVALIFILYARFGNVLPSPFTHRGYAVGRLVVNQYLTHEGIFSSLLGIVATVVAPFILFGSLLQFTGLADLFIDISSKIGKFKGGPAKMALIASTLFGTISGSSTSNVLTTGTTTIPLMKKAGYSSIFAGAVEAASSCGGQLIPPIMGATAFLIAYLTGIPYITIAIAAVIPSIFYVVGIFFCIDLEARRLSLEGIKQTGKESNFMGILKGCIF